MFIGQKVKFGITSDLKVISTQFILNNPNIGKYYGIGDNGERLNGTVIELDISKVIDWVDVKTGEDEGTTTMKHDCRVMWENGYANCFNRKNLKFYNNE